MNKIPTMFVRDPDNRRYVTDEVTPGCEWVIAGEGAATRKYDGTCFAKLEGLGWVARREVKPGKNPPAGFVEISADEVTGKIVGWEPAEASPFAKMWREATYGKHHFHYGTYELIGPKINGNPEGYEQHTLIAHADAQVVTWQGMDIAEAVQRFGQQGYEGFVWHHPDGRMAKLKARDYPTTTPAPSAEGQRASGDEGGVRHG